MSEQNYYELLGLTEEATKNEIKRAYYRQIRIYTNEKHPEQFQLLTKAYETLSDDQKRAEYDRFHQDGGQYGLLLQQVTDAMNENNYSTALMLLEEMLQKYPDDPDVRYFITDCYIAMKKYNDAKIYATDLVLQFPQSEKYRALLYITYLRLEDLSRAKTQIEKLIELNPLERNYYLQLSTIHAKQSRYDQSISVLIEGLQATPIGLEDYTLLSELYFIALIQENHSLKRSTLNKIKALAQTEDKKQILYFIINDCDELDWKHPALPDLIQLVREINNGQYDEVNAWLRDRENLPDTPQSYHESAATVVDEQSVDDHDDGGSLFMAIVVGIILSAIATPIVGIIGGFVYYAYGKKIVRFIGCLIVGLIVLVIIGLILEGF